MGISIPSLGIEIPNLGIHIRNLGTNSVSPNKQTNLITTLPSWQNTTCRNTEKIAYASSFTRGDIIGLMQAITDEIAYQMGQGYSVKIDNLGVFTPALGLRQDRERETGEEGDTKRNAVSICLKDIHFKVDKELLYRTARHCHLKRSTDKFQRSSQVFSPQERLERAKKYLEKNSFMTQADYCQLTGLLKSAASRELREWIANPESGIDYKGRGTHKIYILRKP